MGQASADSLKAVESELREAGNKFEGGEVRMRCDKARTEEFGRAGTVEADRDGKLQYGKYDFFSGEGAQKLVAGSW